MYSASAAMNTRNRTAATPAPKASHEASGWRRRGAYSNSRATEPTANTTPSGHRATLQTASKVSPRSSAPRIAAPPINTTIDSRPSTPAVSASAKAFRYLRRKGRSRSTP
jgi:hypothetical protein